MRSIAVTVVLDGRRRRGDAADAPRSSGASGTPVSTLQVLHTDYASIVEPISGSSTSCASETDQIVVLIPVILPDRCATGSSTTRSTSCSSALRRRTDIVTARVTLPMHLDGRHDDPPEGSTDQVKPLSS